MKVYYPRIERETIWTSAVGVELNDLLDGERASYPVQEEFEWVKIGAKDDMTFPVQCKIRGVEKVVKADVFLVYQDGDYLTTMGVGNWNGTYHDGWGDAHTLFVQALVDGVIMESYRG